MRVCWGCPAVYIMGTPKKHSPVKFLLFIWEAFLYENNCSYDSYYEFILISLFSEIIRKKKKKKNESTFQQVAGLWIH